LPSNEKGTCSTNQESRAKEHQKSSHDQEERKPQMVILDSLAKGHQKSFNQMVIPDSLAKERKKLFLTPSN
jgi:hypothetical protein